MLRLTVFLLLGVLPSVALAAARKPMPSDASLSAAKGLIADTFSKELSASDKVPAIKAMLETAASTKDDDAGQAALYLSAAEVAARTGETKLAFEALEQLGGAFDCDVLALKGALLESAARYARTNEARTSVANRSLELADSAVAAGRFDLAESALKTAGGVSSKLRDAELRKDLAARRKDVEKAKRQREHAQAAYDEAVKTLENKPGDPPANEAVGKHLAFDRNDWPQGLKHLAKAGDDALQQAARADLAGAGSNSASSAGQLAALGDRWWVLGESSESPRDRAGYKSRAVFWYTRASAGLSGLAKTRVEKRLKEAGEEALAIAAEQTGGETGNGKFIDVTLAPGVLMRLVKIPASKDGKIKSFYLGQTEVTQKQWKAVMGSLPGTQQPENYPVVDIKIGDCKRFCEQMNRQIHDNRVVFRLPTRDEFAYVFDGTSSAPENAWTKDNSAFKMQLVATRKPNKFGLYDVLGNCWEWMSDSKFYGMSMHDSPTPEFTSIAASGATIQGNPQDYAAGNVSFRLAAEPR